MTPARCPPKPRGMWLDAPRNPNAPLAGLKVLELARVLAGPWAGQILADLGIDDMILLSNTQPTVVAIEGYGLNIVDHMPIPE